MAKGTGLVKGRRETAVVPVKRDGELAVPPSGRNPLAAARSTLEAADRASANKKAELRRLRFTKAESGKTSDWKIVIITVDDGCVNERDGYGRTLLMLAAAQGRLDTVKKLVEKGANMESIDNYERSALAYAIRGGHLEAAKWLFENTGSWKHDLRIAVRDKWVKGIMIFRKLGATQKDVERAEAKCEAGPGSAVSHRVRRIDDTGGAVRGLELLAPPSQKPKSEAEAAPPPEGKEKSVGRGGYLPIDDFIC